jgi:hypothetical protein
MPKVKNLYGDEIVPKAVEIVSRRPGGIRFSDLRRQIQKSLPNLEPATISNYIWNLHTRVPDQIYKADKGIFRHVKFRETETATAEMQDGARARRRTPYPDDEAAKTHLKRRSVIAEKDFYGPFAEWITKELEECTNAIALGGNRFGDKWGTPDVIGVRESRKYDIIKALPEIVSAEIKIDPRSLITAFGQCCSYKLFSHKSYIVVPKESSLPDKARLDSLCRIFGIGLILFDSKSPNDPEFEIRVRAARHEPDMFYVNEYLKRIKEDLFK